MTHSLLLSSSSPCSCLLSCLLSCSFSISNPFSFTLSSLPSSLLLHSVTSPSSFPPHQRRQELEKEKRKFQTEIAELQEQLAQARQRIEDLEQIKARLEKELAAMTAK